MAKKKKVSPAAAAAAPAGGERVISKLSDEGPIGHLKTLNSRLVKETAEHREKINQLRSEHDAIAADHIFTEGIERDVFGLVLSSHLAELRLANVHLAAERATTAEKKGNLVKTNESSAEKSKELVERLRSMEQKHALMSNEREVAEAKGRKLEEEKMENLLQSSMNQMVLLESFHEEKKCLASKQRSAEYGIQILDLLREISELQSCKKSLEEDNHGLVLKCKELSQKLELMKVQKNKGGIWKWLLPSTAIIVGVVTVAYASRAR